MTSPDAQFPTPMRRANDRGVPPDVPAISGRRVTRLLARWADARRLDPGQAETIRLAVRSAPTDLGFDWWWRLLDPDTGSVFRAATTRSRSGAVVGVTFESPFALAASELTAWPGDDVEYQPYLRLA